MLNHIPEITMSLPKKVTAIVFLLHLLIVISFEYGQVLWNAKWRKSLLKNDRIWSTNGLQRHRQFNTRRSENGGAESEQKSSLSSNVKKPKSENVDLFAAKDRSAIDVITSRPSSSSTFPTSSSVPRVDPLKTHNNALNSTVGTFTRLNQRELQQAEILKLEADRDLTIMDQQRLIDRKRMLMNNDKLLLQLYENKTSIEQILTQHKDMVKKEFLLRIVELANASPSMEERDQLFQWYDGLLEGLLKVDAAQHAEVVAEIQKDFNVEQRKPTTKSASTPAPTYDAALDLWMKQVDAIANSSASSTGGAMNRMVRFPSALPLSIVPFLLRGQEFSTSEIDSLTSSMKEMYKDCLVDSSMYIITVRGEPKEDIKEVYAKVKEKIQEDSKMKDRVRVFLLPEYRLKRNPTRSPPFRNPSSLSPGSSGLSPFPPSPFAPPPSFNYTLNEKISNLPYEPLVVILSNPALLPAPALPQYLFSIFSFLFSLATSLLYSIEVNSFQPDYLVLLQQGNEEVLYRLLPPLLGIFSVQLVHDLSHYLVAALKGIKLSLPYFLPSLQIGLFGSVLPLQSYAKDREQMFDVSLAGPLGGFLASLLALYLGLDITSHASAAELASYPALPSGFFQVSLLLYQWVDSALHLSAAPLTPTPLHPLALTGLIGLLTNAMNFLPIGRLDGGRAVMALGGRRAGNAISFLTIVTLGSSFLSRPNPFLFFFVLTVLFLQRGPDLPPEDDISPLGSKGDIGGDILRGGGFVLCLGLMLAVLLPMPMELMSNINSIQSAPGLFFPPTDMPPTI